MSDWYPGATRLELRPEASSQPRIRPTQVICHSIVAPWDEHRLYAYWRDSTSLESHMGLDYDGSLGQYLPCTTRADANTAANLRPDGTGAISIESASNTSASDPWTDAQVERLADVGVWAHRRYDIPLRICRDHDDPGFGWHKLHRAWSTSGTACPGAKRAQQFEHEVFPEIRRRAQGSPADGEDGPDGLPTVDLSKLIAAAKRDPDRSGTPVSYKGAGRVERALVRERLLAAEYVDAHFGSATVAAYADWQRRLGYTGRDANGIPGKTSLTKLGQRHGFDVKD